MLVYNYIGGEIYNPNLTFLPSTLHPPTKIYPEFLCYNTVNTKTTRNKGLEPWMRRLIEILYNRSVVFSGWDWGNVVLPGPVTSTSHL